MVCARDGAVEHLGVRAVRVLLEEVVLHRPERVEATWSPSDRLLERVLVRGCSLVGVPRASHRDLVEQGEPHGHPLYQDTDRSEDQRWARLDGRVALVTGAASGIGRATAGRLGRGATVVGARPRGERRDPASGARRAAPTSPTRPRSPPPWRPRSPARSPRRRRHRGRRGRRRARAPARRRRVGPRDRRQPQGHVPGRQARDRPDARAGARRASGSSPSPASRASRAPRAAAPTTPRRAASCCSPRTSPSTTAPSASAPTPSAPASSRRR